MKKGKNSVCVILSICVTMSIMLSAGSISIGQENHDVGEYGLIEIDDVAMISSLKNKGINIIEEYDSFVLADISEIQRTFLDNNQVSVIEMNDRTTLSVNGNVFDYEVAEPLMSPDLTTYEYEPNTEGLYLVHLLGPVKNNWVDSLTESGAGIVTYIPNYAYLVKMTPEEAAVVENLPTVDWVGFYHPAYKIAPNLEGFGLSITVLESDSAKTTIESIAQVICIEAINPTEIGYNLLTAEGDAFIVEEFARMTDVQYIGPHSGDSLMDEMGMQIVGGYAWYNDPDSNPNTPYRATGAFGAYVNHLGWTGSGVRVALADTGLGDGSTPDAGHNDFTGRVQGGYVFGGGSWADGHGHGTHCAGLVAADGFNGNGITYAGHGPYYVGMGLAYNSELWGEKIFSDAGGWLGAAYGDIPMDPNNGGADIHSNSWGESFGDGQYDARCEAYDQRARDDDDGTAGNQLLTIFVAAGNSGSGPSLGGPSTGKNVIAVGSLENYMPDAGSYGNGVDSGDNPDTVSSFSSRGTTDNRIKPDIMTPGQATLSTLSPNAAPGCLYGVYSGDPRYEWCSGTSQACPTAAGGGALIYEWYDATYGAPPTPAMNKALLINTAVDLGGAGPDGPDDLRGP